ncbi:MAG: hypothetical protein ACRDZO_22205, partial [Egibacteraceae bacterium]
MRVREATQARVLNLRVGELVRVRSKGEILATLDEEGELDSLPLMPEMLQFCGQQLVVYKVAHKLCDTIEFKGMRRMEQAVHLEGARCGGEAHGGCQAGCLIYWKEAWLERVNSIGNGEVTAGYPAEAGRCTLPILTAATRKEPTPAGEEVFSCQATEILRAAPEYLPFRDIGQYVQDIRSGNVGVRATLHAFAVGLFNRVQEYSRRGLPRALWFRGGLRWGFLEGKAAKTPTGRTDLQPGDLVQVKPVDEILRTVNAGLLNRGLSFDQEMVKYCGQHARVLRRVNRIVDDKTGKMLELSNPCIVLDNVVCSGDYNVSCPRAIYP